MAHQKNWTMPAQVIRVVDGDTVDLICDLGFRVKITIRARLYAIDTPDMKGPSRADGMHVRRMLEDLVEEWRVDDSGDEVGHPWVLIETYENRSDSFGLWIVRLIGRGGVDLNRKLVAAGIAQPADHGSDKSPYRGSVPE